jgi:hypothetical protein
MLGGFGSSYYFYNKMNELDVELKIRDQNNVALTDSIHSLKDKVGDIEYAKAILISSKDELESLNKGLSDELRKTKGKVSELTKTIITLEGEIQDLESKSGHSPDTINPDFDFRYNIEWSISNYYGNDNNQILSGVSYFNIAEGVDNFILKNVSSKLLVNKLKLNLIQGLRERNGIIEVFAKSDFPGFGVDGMSSVIIDPNEHPVFTRFTKKKPNLLSIGPYIGYGITYNFKRAQALHGLQIGVGVNYKFNF